MQLWHLDIFTCKSLIVKRKSFRTLADSIFLQPTPPPHHKLLKEKNKSQVKSNSSQVKSKSSQVKSKSSQVKCNSSQI